MGLIRNILAPAIVLFLGILFIVLSIIQGNAEVALLLFIPVIYGAGIYLMIGIVLIFLSFILFFVFSFSDTYKKSHRRMKKEVYEDPTESKETESSYGGVIFIGPIPIVFGKDASTTKKMMWIGLVIALILVFLYIMIVFL
ncbi:MAG: DUF131 domain-containing protein [Candidatus Thermoplasmatota archaeon]